MSELDTTSPPPIAQLAQPVLNYATPNNLRRPRATVLATRILAITQLVLGMGAICWSTTIIFSFEGPLYISLPLLACGIVHSAIGVLMLRPQPSNWKTARVMLAVLLFPALGFIVFGVVLFLLFHERTGMDQLGAAIGGVVAVIATGPYALNLFTLRYLLRPYP